MKNKIIFGLIIILALISLSAVSASDNVTDGAEIGYGEEISLESEYDNQIIEENGMGSGDVNQAEADDNILGDGNENDGAVQTPKINSTISASNVVGYETFSTKVVVKLTADGKNMASKKINVTVNNVVYKRTTDSKGQVTLSFSKLKKGTYEVFYTYAGDENTTACNGTSKMTIKSPTKTQLKIFDKNMNYRQGLKNPFIVRLLDSNGKAIKNQVVTFKVKGKSYNKKTDSKGYAEIALKLKKGKYKVTYKFSKNSPYLGSSGSFTVKMKAPMAKGNGYWVWPKHMKNLNLKALSKKGTKHVFLEVSAISAYGKSAVVKWISKAHKYGIKVHLWICVCSDGENWVSPVNKDNTFKYWFINKKVKEAIKYSKIKGVDGIHLDYIRFGGTAYKYKTSTQAINYIVKKICVGIHKSKPNCIVSAAVMPEVSKMTYWYGQDISTMGRYLDVIVPMVYKGNFNQKSSWITKVVKTYKKQSKSAVIWAGLQTYHSDDNAKLLSYKALMKDAKAAKAGGAVGSILFRMGITHYLNFKKV